MAEVVSRWSLMTEAYVQPQASLCGISGGQSDTGACFYLHTLDFPHEHHSTNAAYSFIYP
jgi:hypothetical protein